MAPRKKKEREKGKVNFQTCNKKKKAWHPCAGVGKKEKACIFLSDKEGKNAFFSAKGEKNFNDE